MKRTLILGFLFPVFCFAQTFERKIKAANGEKIGFLEFRPADYNNGKHPLIIFLHGVGEKGNGTSQLKDVKCCGIPAYIRAGNKMRFTWQGKTESFIVLSPQLAKKYGVWQPFYTDELIKYAKGNLNIDPDRIFVTGLSLGGGGTWNFASSSLERAKLLAGIAPVVAPCMMANPCNISKAALPVMAIHSWDDKNASPNCTVNAVKSINSCNPSVSPNLIMYPNGGHYVWVQKAFDTIHSYQDPNIYEWFLAQNRKLPPNKKPNARAGKDIIITTGDGEVMLDGSASTDADGKIVRYIWTKISGPAEAAIDNAHSAKTKIKKLTSKGIYKYQLKVVDSRAEWSLDTVTVNVEKGEAAPNKSPFADAGEDVTIQLPVNSATLDGSLSKDPDGSLASFKWSKKDGPSKFEIAEPSKSKTSVNNLEEGVYVFTLKVTDNRGGTSTDDVRVTVNAAPDNVPDEDHGEQQPGEVITPPAEAVGIAVSVYPNPSSNNAVLSMNFPETGPIAVVLYDLYGRPVMKSSIVKTSRLQQHSVYVSNLIRGVYVVEVITWNRKYVARIVRR